MQVRDHAVFRLTGVVGGRQAASLCGGPGRKIRPAGATNSTLCGSSGSASMPASITVPGNPSTGVSKPSRTSLSSGSEETPADAEPSPARPGCTPST